MEFRDVRRYQSGFRACCKGLHTTDFPTPRSREQGAADRTDVARSVNTPPPFVGETLRDMILVSKSLVPAALSRGARAAALALLALAWLASPGAQAQTGGARVSDVLVSNTGQSDVAGLGVGAKPVRAGLQTPGIMGAVTTWPASFWISRTAPRAAAGTITVTVREDSSGNPSGNVLYTLINPAFSVGSNEFRAPLNAELDEDRDLLGRGFPRRQLS